MIMNEDGTLSKNTHVQQSLDILVVCHDYRGILGL